ncbi:putative ankyrin repeat protein RF_0381 [Microplitis demolitor]|uniref:putative ankyrin repeat protein RF_0381 n=1 Tax=Microplitis demolitor TaxID=69319 RepID=UPI00235B5F86|nr:putative ankyrin repeat protein RF_0381 [Microplitis demolitor]
MILILIVSADCQTFISILHYILQFSKEVSKLLNSYLVNVPMLTFVEKMAKNRLQLPLKKKNLKLFQLLLNAGAKIHDCSDKDKDIPPHKDPLLHHAVAVKSHCVTKFLLKRGFNVDGICDCPVSKYLDCTPLQLAVSTEHLIIVNLLLKYKAIVNKNTKKLGSVTGIAVDRSNYNLYKLVYNAGVNLDDPLNMTLLHRAVDANNYDIVKHLIDRKVNVNAIDKSVTSQYYGCSPLYIAIKNHNKEIITLLLEYGAKVDNDEFIKTPLGIACECGNFELVQTFVKAGADINKISNKAMPLYWAVSKQNFEIAEYLVKFKANINISYKGTTLLQKAVESGNTKLVKLLLKNDVELDAINDSGDTALIVAVEIDHLEMIEILIDAGATVNSSNETIYSPLHRAVQRSNYNITQYLIKKKAEINSIRFSKTPLNIACYNGRKDIAELLIKNGAIVDDERVYMTALGIACEQANFELVELLVKSGSSVDLRSGGATPLYWAVNSKNFRIVKYVIDRGVGDIDAGRWGTSPLYLAIKNQDLNIVEFLIEHRATVNKVIENGTTALGLAIKTRNFKLVELILHAEDIDINALCYDNLTPLEAGKQANLLILNLLLDAGVDINRVNETNQISNISTNCERNKNIIIKHMIKLKAAGCYLNNENKKAIRCTEGSADFHSECLKELKNMKKSKIDKTIMNYYHIMRKNFYEIALKLNNFNNETLNERELQLQFPLYGRILYYRLVKSLQRKKLSNISNNVFGT